MLIFKCLEFIDRLYIDSDSRQPIGADGFSDWWETGHYAWESNVDPFWTQIKSVDQTVYLVNTDGGNYIYTDKSYQNISGWYKAQAFTQQEKAIPEYRFLHTDRVDMFMERVTRELDSETTIIRENIVMLEFNKSGTKVKYSSGIQRITTINGSETDINYSKVYISSGFGANIQVLEKFWRPQSLVKDYLEFILSPQDPAKRNLNISAPHDSQRPKGGYRDPRGSEYH